MNRRVLMSRTVAAAATGLGLAGFRRGEAAPAPVLGLAPVADRLYAVTDDFIVDLYHNGRKVADARRELIEEVYGATAEKIELELRPGDWLVFNVVNNRMRWGGASYFAVAARGPQGFAFTTEAESGRWSFCDDLASVPEFIKDPLYGDANRARLIDVPWAAGDEMMNRHADGWNGKPVWGASRNTWIKYCVR